MTVVWYLIFLAATYIVALQIFRLTTYHASFFKGAPLLLGYSVLVGYLLFVFNLAPFFIWHLVANVVLFTVKLKGEAKPAKRMLKALGVDSQQRHFAQMSFSLKHACALHPQRARIPDWLRCVIPRDLQSQRGRHRLATRCTWPARGVVHLRRGDLECLGGGLRHRLAVSAERFKVSRDGFLNEALDFVDAVPAANTARQVRHVGTVTPVTCLFNDDNVLHENTSFQAGLLENAVQRAGRNFARQFPASRHRDCSGAGGMTIL